MTLQWDACRDGRGQLWRWSCVLCIVSFRHVFLQSPLPCRASRPLVVSETRLSTSAPPVPMPEARAYVWDEALLHLERTPRPWRPLEYIELRLRPGGYLRPSPSRTGAQLNLTRTKTIEQSIARHRGVRAPAAQGARPAPADRLRCRRDHRHRHLRAHRRGGRGEGRAGGGAVVRVLRHRLRAGRALLRGVRQHRAGGRLGLHVLLRQPRRAGRLDHRLGPDPGAGPGRQHGRRGLVDVLRRRHGARPGSPSRAAATARGTTWSPPRSC